MRDVHEVLPFGHVVGEVVGEREADAPRRAAVVDDVDAGHLGLLAGGQRERPASAIGLRDGDDDVAVALVEPLGLRADAPGRRLAGLEPQPEHLHRIAFGAPSAGWLVHLVARLRAADVRETGAGDAQPRRSPDA